MFNSGSGDPVTVYWRPGCPYCAALRWRLRRLGVATTEIDIWSEPAAAEEVRRITGGDETVPTVVVGATAMVNPSARRVLEAIGLADAGTQDVGQGRPRVSSRPAANVGSRPAAVVAAWSVVSVAVVASFTVDALGHHGLSWAIDGVAVLAYLMVRWLRRRTTGAGTGAAGAEADPGRNH